MISCEQSCKGVYTWVFLEQVLQQLHFARDALCEEYRGCPSRLACAVQEIENGEFRGKTLEVPEATDVRFGCAFRMPVQCMVCCSRGSSLGKWTQVEALAMEWNLTHARVLVMPCVLCWLNQHAKEAKVKLNEARIGGL